MGDQLTLRCKGWQQEGILRMLENCLDPDIAKHPSEFIVYGGTGKAVRDQESLQRIKHCLINLKDNETLVIQSGKPVGVFSSTTWGPRVIMSGTMLVPKWCTWDTYFELSKKNLTTYGQSTAASWSYIGTQGIMQGTWETFKQVAREHFRGTLTGKLVLTSGLGEMGCAQPIAVTANGGVCIVVDVDKPVVKKRLNTSMIDVLADSLDEALDYANEALKKKEPLSIGLVGNAADIYGDILLRNIKPDIVTDQTPAHDVYNSYIPSGVKPGEAASLREKDPDHYGQLINITLTRHLKAMLAFQQRGSVVFDYGNNIRGAAKKAGVAEAFSFPNFISKYLRPLFCEGRGPFRWIALSGDPEDIYKTDEVILNLFPYDTKLKEWLDLVQQRFTFHGLPARVCWLNFEERPIFGQVINEMVKTGEISGPVAMTRDHMDAGSVASPYRETEGMLDGSDAIADWPILNALLNAACGASLVGIYQGGGVGIGYSIHSGMSIIADGSDDTGDKLALALKWDPGFGIVRYADAGYPAAVKILQQQGVKLPMSEAKPHG